MDAHDPYRPPRPFDGYFSESAFPWIQRLQKYGLRFMGQLDKKSWYSYLLSQYDGEIAYLDHHLGKLFKKLKQLAAKFERINQFVKEDVPFGK